MFWILLYQHPFPGTLFIPFIVTVASWLCPADSVSLLPQGKERMYTVFAGPGVEGGILFIPPPAPCHCPPPPCSTLPPLKSMQSSCITLSNPHHSHQWKLLHIPPVEIHSPIPILMTQTHFDPTFLKAASSLNSQARKPPSPVCLHTFLSPGHLGWGSGHPQIFLAVYHLTWTSWLTVPTAAFTSTLDSCSSLIFFLLDRKSVV